MTPSGTMILLLILLTLLPLVLMIIAVNWKATPRWRWKERLFFTDEGSSRSHTALSGTPEVPFSQRKRTLKVCPDCREFVFLKAPACKFCGYAFPIPPQEPRVES